MNKEAIKENIIRLFNEKPILEGIDPGKNFFDLGASSLTVVDLQMKVEKAINLEAETSALMLEPTINGWVNIYSANC